MQQHKSYFYFVLFLFLSLCSTYVAHLVETDFGQVNVSRISFMTEEGKPMQAKLYQPLSATAESPAPALLALHGYQSDKEATTTFGAIELSRRGFVVLAIDHFGHGYSTELPASNQNMSGANNGYQYLKTLPFVDKNRLGIFGHSTGALNAIRVAKLNPDHKAINGLSSNGGDSSLNNYLLTQGLYEEIGGYREKTFPVKDLIHNKARLSAFSLFENDELKWNHQYGNFLDGSGRKAVLVNGTHLGVMISEESNKEAILWFNQALQGGLKDQKWIDENKQIYWYKEFGSLFALLFTLFSAFNLANILLESRYFQSSKQKPANDTLLNHRQWWLFAVINIFATLILYPLLTQWGGANEPIAATLSFMPLEMGNGIITWLTISGILNLIAFLYWKRNKYIGWDKFGVLSIESSITKIITRSFILSVIIVGYLYLLAFTSYHFFDIELRFLWPLLKPLTIERASLFLIYWIPILFFLWIFNGFIISVQMKQKLSSSFYKTLIIWSGKSCIFAVGGLVLLWLFHFVPNFMQLGPGFDLLGLPQFGGRWIMMLAVIIPQFIVFTIINHWCYLKTGYIYFGIFLTSLLMTWILVGGQVIGRFLA